MSAKKQMSNKIVQKGVQPSSAVVPAPKGNVTSKGNIAGRNKSATATIKREVKKEIKKDFNMGTVTTKSGKQKLVYTVPECSRHYLAARLDPFETIGGACMPSANFNFPSLKTKVVAAGTFRLGTTGVGYLAFLPAWGSDSANIVCTSSGSVGTTATALSAFTNLTTSSFPQLPYPSASFGSDLQGRHVASGMRCQYMGSLMNRNGTGFAYCDPDHSSVTNTATINSFGNIETCRRIGLTNASGNWPMQVCDNGPVVASEISFAQASSVQSTPYMVLAVVGTAGDLYEYEVVMHVELQGRIVPGMTPSHVDETTYPILDTTLKEAFNHGPPQKEESPGILRSIVSGIQEHLPSLQGIVSGSVPAIVKGIMGLIPMTGSNPMLSGLDGFTRPGLPMLMSMQDHQAWEKTISEGGGRGSNLRVIETESWLRAFAQIMVDKKLSPIEFIQFLERRSEEVNELQRVKRNSLPEPMTPPPGFPFRL